MGRKRWFNTEFIHILLFSGGMLTVCCLSLLWAGEPVPDGSAAAISGAENSGKTLLPQYKKGELVVKLKEGAGLQGIAELNRKYNVTEEKPLFNDIPSSATRLKDLKDKLESVDARLNNRWYRQLDKDYKFRLEKERRQLSEQIQRQEAQLLHIQQRKKRAAEGKNVSRPENVYLLKTADAVDIDAMAQEYSRNTSVEYAQPNYIRHALALALPDVKYIPDDPYISRDRVNWSSFSLAGDYPDLWGLRNIKALEAWNTFADPAGDTGKGVLVAVVDSGVDYGHEDLRDNMWEDGLGHHGYNFIEKDYDPMDDFGHGTHCAGIIAACAGNGKGISGVAPHARIMAVKSLDEDGSGSDVQLAEGVIFAVENGADVISNSWGSTEPSSLMIDTMNYAFNYGCVVVVSAGNDNSDASGKTPANIECVITVAAVDQADGRSSFSNYGELVDVAAPGGADIEDEYLQALYRNNIVDVADRLNGGENDLRDSFIEKLTYIVNYCISESTDKSETIGQSESWIKQWLSDRNLDFSPPAGESKESVIERLSSDLYELCYKRQGGRNVISTMIPEPRVATLFYRIEDGYYRMRGTSMAAPFVAGVSALILSKRPDLTNREVEKILKDSADDLGNAGKDDLYGYGRINAYNALASLSPNRIKRAKILAGVTLNDPGNKMALERGKKCSLAFSVRSTGGMALNNVILTLTSDSPFVKIAQGVASWETIPSVSTADNRQNPFVIEVSPIAPWGEKVDFRLNLESEGGYSMEKEYSLIVERVRLMPGWPKRIGTNRISPMSMYRQSGRIPSVTVADINSDGYKEILAGNYFIDDPGPGATELYGWDFRGKPLPVFSPLVIRTGGVPRLDTYIAVGNVSGDERPEISAVMGGYNRIETYIWDSSGDLVVPPFGCSETGHSTHPAGGVVLADMRGKGMLDVLFSYNMFYGGGIKCTGLSGGSLSEWEVKGNDLSVLDFSAGDIDNDGYPEVVFCSGAGIYIIDHAGVVSDFGKCDDSVHNLVIGDIDNDGKKEILVSVPGRIIIFNNHGERIRTLTAPYFSCHISLADLDNDGDLEILGFEVLEKALCAWHHDGTVVKGWPAKIGAVSLSTPVSGDIDRDGNLEVVIAALDKKLYAFRANGDSVPGFPVAMEDVSTATPVLDDINRDGYIDIVIPACDSNVYIYSVEPVDDPVDMKYVKMPWPMIKHDTRYSGCYEGDSVSGKVKTPPSPQAVDLNSSFSGKSVVLSAEWQRSDDPEVTYEYALGTALGRDDLKPWSSCGSDTFFTYTVEDITQIKLTVYYASVRALNSSGRSPAVSSSGLRLFVPKVSVQPRAAMPGSVMTFTFISPEADYLYLLIRGPDPARSMFCAYDKKSGKLYLNGSGWEAVQAVNADKSPVILESRYVKLNCSNAVVIDSGSCLTLRLPLEFKAGLTGQCSVYSRIRNGRKSSQWFLQDGFILSDTPPALFDP